MKTIKKNSIALVVLVLAAGSLWLTNRAVTPEEASWNDVVSQAEAGGYKIITTEELWEHYNRTPENILIVDTRQEWEFRTGHIKGAVNFPMEPTWLSRWKKKEALERFLGPDTTRTLVFY